MVRRQLLNLWVVVVLLCTGGFAQNGQLASLLDGDHFKELARAFDSAQTSNPRTLFLLSKLKQSLHKHDEALQYAEAAVKADPASPEYHLQLASVMSDEIDEAGVFRKMSIAGRVRSDLETALKLAPQNPDCLRGMMMYYEQAPRIAGGSRKKAHQLAAQIGRIDQAKGYLAQAELARTEKLNGRLEGLYLKAVKADPGNVEALMELASYYLSDWQKP